MKRENIIPKILEILQTQAEATVDLLDALTSNYADSRRKIWRSLKSGPEPFETDWADKYRQRQVFYSLLNKLKNQGLIEKNKSTQGKTIWQITKNGLEKIGILKSKKSFIKTTPRDYRAESDKNVKIIIFDVPEKERQKREWLRGIIFALGFKMLQRSVWIGKKRIPEGFLFDLKKLNMLSYVHVFKVTKGGTISKIL